jgi:hypothetical protein
MKMQITRGKIVSAQKVVVYGPEGIGKSTFASHFPNPLFIDVEGSTKKLDVARMPIPTSWTMLLEHLKYVKANPKICGTLVIDSADWAEALCIKDMCAEKNWDGIENLDYGKGYVYLGEKYGKFLNLLEEIVELGVNVVFTAHVKTTKIDLPNETGSFDRWELKLQKKTAPLLKEWADMVLFASYKTLVVNVDGKGTAKGKNKAQGGNRVMYTTHNPCWDAKNRDGLADELDFKFECIAHCVPILTHQKTEEKAIVAEPKTIIQDIVPELPKVETIQTELVDELDGIPKPLADLMRSNGVTVAEIQTAVASKGYYPIDTPIQNYDPTFVNGVLVAAWVQVLNMVKMARLEAGE